MDKIIIRMPYIEKITVAQKIRPKYHLEHKYKGEGKKKLPKKYNNEYFKFIGGVLTDVRDNIKVISNVRKVGEPRYWIVNFQPIYNGSMNPIQRSVYMNILKDLMNNWIDIPPITEFPLRLELFIYSNEMKVDVDNKGVIFFKVFSDILTSKKIIPDDSSEYIRDTGRVVWIPSPRHREGMEFHISKIE